MLLQRNFRNGSWTLLLLMRRPGLTPETAFACKTRAEGATRREVAISRIDLGLPRVSVLVQKRRRSDQRAATAPMPPGEVED